MVVSMKIILSSLMEQWSKLFICAPRVLRCLCIFQNYRHCGRVASSLSNYIFALASMSLKIFFFARGRQVLSAIDKRSRNILDSRVYLGYRISEVRGENKGIL